MPVVTPAMRMTTDDDATDADWTRDDLCVEIDHERAGHAGPSGDPGLQVLVPDLMAARQLSCRAARYPQPRQRMSAALGPSPIASVRAR